MKHRDLNGIDCRLRVGRTQYPLELVHDPALGLCFRVGFQKNVECELSAEYFLFHLLKIEQADGLLLKFVHSRLSSFRRGLENRYCRRLYGKRPLQVSKKPSDNDGRRVWVDKITL